MNIRSTLAVTLLCFVVMGGGSHLAHAGFMLSDEQTSSQSQSSTTQKGITFESYDVDKGIDESAPALKVFNERYIPDSVRAKYNLPENWSNAPAATSSPIDLSPEPLPEVNPVEITKPTVIISQPSSPVQTVDTWRARKGESIRDVLRRWSDRQGVDLMWASPNTPSLQKDFSFVGKFQDAVGKLLKETGGEDLHSQFRSEGLDPVMMAPASTVTTNMPAPEVVPAEESKKEEPNSVSKIFEPVEPKALPETRWFGLSGAPLGEVLKVWAEQADIVLIWQAESNYALKESISQVGTFEDAVYKALSQYDGDLVRPVGEVYMDENSGQKVLVIRSDAS